MSNDANAGLANSPLKISDLFSLVFLTRLLANHKVTHPTAEYFTSFTVLNLIIYYVHFNDIPLTILCI